MDFHKSVYENPFFFFSSSPCRVNSLGILDRMTERQIGCFTKVIKTVCGAGGEQLGVLSY